MEKKFVKCLYEQVCELRCEWSHGPVFITKEATADWWKRWYKLRSYIWVLFPECREALVPFEVKYILESILEA